VKARRKNNRKWSAVKTEPRNPLFRLSHAAAAAAAAAPAPAPPAAPRWWRPCVSAPAAPSVRSARDTNTRHAASVFDSTTRRAARSTRATPRHAAPRRTRAGGTRPEEDGDVARERVALHCRAFGRGDGVRGARLRGALRLARPRRLGAQLRRSSVAAAWQRASAQRVSAGSVRERHKRCRLTSAHATDAGARAPASLARTAPRRPWWRRRPGRRTAARPAHPPPSRVRCRRDPDHRAREGARTQAMVQRGCEHAVHEHACCHGSLQRSRVARRRPGCAPAVADERRLRRSAK
jgi:hypothetical protein